MARLPYWGADRGRPPGGFTSTGSSTQVSANTARTFAGFAARGQPGSGVAPWSRELPQYLRIDKENSVEVDYSTQYHIAAEQSRNRTEARRLEELDDLTN